MIFCPFYNKILIKDYSFSDSWNEELITTLKYLSLEKDKYCGHTEKLEENYELLKYDEQKNDKPYIVTEKNSHSFPIIKTLRNLFLECFHEYNNSFEEKIDNIDKIFLKDEGNLATLKYGQRVGLHQHPSYCFAIFYLTDVDNEKDGGELVLLDPSFNTQNNFCSAKEYKVKTKKNRMVVASSYIWHEVTPYYGKKERLCAVIDLGRK
jgi:hypothetical protein